MPKNEQNLMALRLTVNNHPGVMTHVCGLFARRAFNVEGILCTPQEDGTTSRIWLVVKRDERLEQMIRQVRKLYDVLEVLAFEADATALARMALCVGAARTVAAREIVDVRTGLAGPAMGGSWGLRGGTVSGLPDHDRPGAGLEFQFRADHRGHVRGRRDRGDHRRGPEQPGRE